MNGRRKKLFVVPALVAVAGLVWVGTANSEPPDGTGQFDLVGTTNVVTYFCDAAGGTGTAQNSLEFEVFAHAGAPAPGTGSVAPTDVPAVTGYDLVGNPTNVPLNGSMTYIPAGDIQACPPALPADVFLAEFANAIGADTVTPASFDFSLHFELGSYGS